MWPLVENEKLNKYLDLDNLELGLEAIDEEMHFYKQVFLYLHVLPLVFIVLLTIFTVNRWSCLVYCVNRPVSRPEKGQPDEENLNEE